MTRSLASAAMILALALSGAARSDTTTTEQITPGTYGLTADGTWDCRDAGGTYLGAIVIAELSYALIGPDGAAKGYGRLNMDDWMDRPAFFILGGALKEEFGAVGMSMTGPIDRPEDFGDWSKLELKVVVSAENIFRCGLRRGPAT